MEIVRYFECRYNKITEIFIEEINEEWKKEK